MEFKIEEESSHIINIEKIIRINVGKIKKIDNQECYFAKIYFGKECYSTFNFPTFEIANKFSNIIQQRYKLKGSSYYTPFVDAIGIQNDLLKLYFKENEKNKSNDKSVYYKSNDINYES